LTHGFLDTVPVDDILAFESQLFDFFDMNHKDLLETIVTTKDLPAEDLRSYSRIQSIISN
jgi:F-type H+-transporting ATPase subunit alpha